MKKMIGIISVSIILTACGGGTSNLEQQELNQEERSNTVENKNTDDTSNDTASANEDDTQKEEPKIDSNKQRIISNFIEDIYINNEISSISDIDNIDELTTEAYSNELNDVLNEFKEEARESEIGDVETNINNIELYDNMSNRQSELIYILESEVVNHDSENVNLTQIVGKIELEEEDNTIKINNISELSNQAMNE